MPLEYDSNAFIFFSIAIMLIAMIPLSIVYLSTIYGSFYEEVIPEGVKMRNNFRYIRHLKGRRSNHPKKASLKDYLQRNLSHCQ